MFDEKNSVGLYYKSLFVIPFLMFFVILSSKAQDSKELTDNAVIISQSVPDQMFTGHTYSLFVRLRNTGTTVWTPDYYKLALVKQGSGELWNFKPVSVRSRVEKGSDVTFSFRVKAPPSPGKYSLKLQMETRGNRFGESAGPPSIKVTGEPFEQTNPQVEVKTKGDDSQFLMQIMTNEMTADSRYEVSVTMQNTGKTIWTKKDGYALGFLDKLLNIENNNLKFTKISLTDDVPPGKEVTFSFPVKAPSAPGTYEYQWKMEHGDIYFGEPSDKYSVKVN